MQESQVNDMKLTSQQDYTLLNLLQQQSNHGVSAPNNISHINQLGTVSSSDHCTIGNVYLWSMPPTNMIRSHGS